MIEQEIQRAFLPNQNKHAGVVAAEKKRQLRRFDWQQSCVNNVAQEWAWNWHFLEPEFLTEHEVPLGLSSRLKVGRFG